jgi:GNAT superfamily N-acetyltransferase
MIEISNLNKMQTFDLDHDEGLNAIHVSLMIVQERFRGQGYGSQVLQGLIQYARQHGMCVKLVPDDAYGTPKHILERFYEKNGGIFHADGHYYFS